MPVRLARGAALVVAAVGAIGCTAHAPVRLYTGPELPVEQVARLTGSTHYNIWIAYNRTTYVGVVSVDDQVSVGRADEWLMLPGPHKVESTYQVHRFIAAPYAWANIRHSPHRGTTQFVARAGRRYRVDGEEVIGPNRVKGYRSWIEDAETGEVVSTEEETLKVDAEDVDTEPDGVEEPAE